MPERDRAHRLRALTDQGGMGRPPNGALVPKERHSRRRLVVGGQLLGEPGGRSSA